MKLFAALVVSVALSRQAAAPLLGLAASIYEQIGKIVVTV
jgi:hypothetical protein